MVNKCTIQQQLPLSGLPTMVAGRGCKPSYNDFS